MNKFILPVLFLVACKQPSVSPPPASAEKIAWEFTESMNGAREHMKIDSVGRIELSSGAETDFFIEPGSPPYEKANAPLLLKVVDNTRPFTFSFKTTPVHKVKYDAGMAFIWVDAKNWLKFAFEADERMNTRLVTVKTHQFSDDNNHDAVKSPFVYLKISSDTKVIGFYYSLDGKDWQLVRVFKNDYPPQIRLGVGPQSPAGQGNTAIFEGFEFAGQSVKDFRMGI